MDNNIQKSYDDVNEIVDRIIQQLNQFEKEFLTIINKIQKI